MWAENQQNQIVSNQGVLADVLVVELLRWVVVKCLDTEAALEVCGPWARCAQFPGTLSNVAALTAWQKPMAWARCQRRVDDALARGDHRRFAPNLPCPTAALFGSPSVEDIWDLLKREHAHRSGH